MNILFSVLKGLFLLALIAQAGAMVWQIIMTRVAGDSKRAPGILSLAIPYVGGMLITAFLLLLTEALWASMNGQEVTQSFEGIINFIPRLIDVIIDALFSPLAGS